MSKECGACEQRHGDNDPCITVETLQSENQRLTLLLEEASGGDASEKRWADDYFKKWQEAKSELEKLKQREDCKDGECGIGYLIEENKKLLDAYEAQEAELARAREVIGFYGDKKNWIFSRSLTEIHPRLSPGIERLLIKDDTDIGLRCNGETDNIGGYRARKYLSSIKGEDGGI